MTKLEYLQSVMPEPYWRAFERNVAAQGNAKHLQEIHTGNWITITELQWTDTPEGHSFWKEVDLSVRKSAPFPPYHPSWTSKPQKKINSLERIRLILPDLFYQAVVRNVMAEDETLEFIKKTYFTNPLTCAFTWSQTQEGAFFWEEVHRWMQRKDSAPSLAFDIAPHPSWSTTPQPLSDHDGLETPNKGQTTTTTMLHKYADKPVATPTLVNGQDVTDLTDRDILNQIKARKKSVEEIVATGATGAYVDHFRTQEGIAVEALLKELNSRAPQATPAA